jgi:hypothetical protein
MNHPLITLMDAFGFIEDHLRAFGYQLSAYDPRGRHPLLALPVSSRSIRLVDAAISVQLCDASVLETNATRTVYEGTYLGWFVRVVCNIISDPGFVYPLIGGERAGAAFEENPYYGETLRPLIMSAPLVGLGPHALRRHHLTFISEFTSGQRLVCAMHLIHIGKDVRLISFDRYPVLKGELIAHTHDVGNLELYEVFDYGVTDSARFYAVRFAPPE